MSDGGVPRWALEAERDAADEARKTVSDDIAFATVVPDHNVCRECGAVMADVIRHGLWHRKMDRWLTNLERTLKTLRDKLRRHKDG